jgi:taurine transport system permease protein
VSFAISRRRSSAGGPATLTAPASPESTGAPGIAASGAAGKAEAAVRTSRFATPGEGPTTLISAVTIVAIFVLWWLASHYRWVPPLFLPTPEVVA